MGVYSEKKIIIERKRRCISPFDMAAIWMRLLLVATVTWMAASEFDDEICSIVKESNGLVPPPLAANFETKGDHVDSDQKSVLYNEMYVDYANMKAKYLYLLKGIEHHFLFDYDVQQVVEWDVFHPGVDIRDDPLSHLCQATALEDSPRRFMFGFLDDYTERLKMYDAHQMLRFGGNYPYAFDGTDRLEQRGLVADKFTGCIFDLKMDATVQANYSFTNNQVLTSGGTTVEEVTGVEQGVLSVPAQVSYSGAVYDAITKDYKTFRKTENYYWFKGEPEFEWGTFQVPPYLYCEDYRGREEIPKLPTAFSTRLQLTTIERDTLGKMAAQEVTTFEEVYYYKEKGLARRDFMPDPEDTSLFNKEIFSNFASYEPVKSVFDFNTGIAYITHKPTGHCYTRPIQLGDYFEKSRKSLFIQMGSPEEVFHMQVDDDMQYKGPAFARDIECDVWIGKYVDEVNNVTTYKETHFTTNGWHEQADEVLDYKVSVKHSVIKPDLADKMEEGGDTYNFLKFKVAPPYLKQFDVSNCITSDIEHRDFGIELTISDEIKKIIFDYKHQFLDAAQYYIEEYAQTFTPLRVQRMELRQMSLIDSRSILLFTLVGKSALKTQTPVGQPGPSLEKSIDLLSRFISTNSFAIQFHPPGSKETVLVTALRGSLYVKTSDGTLQAPPAPLKGEETPSADDVQIHNVFFEDEKDEEGKKGMSSGNLTLLALSMLFIGIGIGIAVMYLYVRKMSENSLEDRITLTPQVSTVESPPSTSADSNQ